MLQQRCERAVIFRWIVAVAVASGWAWPGGAQDAAPAASPAKELVRQAYAKTSTAKTLGDYTEIIELCEQAQRGELAPAMAAYVNDLLAWAHNRRGETYTQEGASLSESGQAERADKIDQMALAEFEAAVQLKPDYWKALHNRGVSYALAGKFDEAVADFSRVVELQPDYGNAWFNRAEIYFERGRFQEALTDYDQAIRLKGDDAEAFLHRGHARFQLRQYREALADYEQAVKLAPNLGEALASRGDAYRSLGQWSQASADYRRAVTLDGSSVRAHQSAAWLMATCPETPYRNAQLALEYAKKAVAVGGQEDFQLLDTLAAAYANAGDFAAAKQQLEAALKLAPESQAPALRARLTLYQQNQPYRERLPTTTRPR